MSWFSKPSLDIGDLVESLRTHERRIVMLEENLANLTDQHQRLRGKFYSSRMHKQLADEEPVDARENLSEMRGPQWKERARRELGIGRGNFPHKEG